MNNQNHKIKIVILAALGFALVSNAQQKASPFEKPNNTAITLSGTVTKAGPDSFQLDYGVGSVKVEVDDYDWFREGSQLVDGDYVTVRGMIDRDSGEQTKIEAGSVYVKNRNIIYYANAADEEGAEGQSREVWYPDTVLPKDESFASFTGVVTSVGERSFVLDTDGIRSLKVNISTMAYNPIVNVGDRLLVSGKFDWNLFSKDEVAARSITKLMRNY